MILKVKVFSNTYMKHLRLSLVGSRRGWRLWQKGKTKKGKLIMSYITSEKVSLSLPCSLMHSQGSLLVSSHASITNTTPPCSLTGDYLISLLYIYIFLFYFILFTYLAIRWTVFMSWKPSDYTTSTFLEVCVSVLLPTDMSVGRSTDREKQTNWLSLEYVTMLRQPPI